MRKLLLATVAGLSVTTGVAGYAEAQTTGDTSGQSFPEPGTLTVRLNGRMRFYAGVAAGQRQADTPNGGKNANYGFLDYVRLYPGFDGVAANGLKYGASLEIRQDLGGPPGGGVNGSIGGANANRSKLYLNRE